MVGIGVKLFVGNAPMERVLLAGLSDGDGTGDDDCDVLGDISPPLVARAIVFGDVIGVSARQVRRRSPQSQYALCFPSETTRCLLPPLF